MRLIVMYYRSTLIYILGSQLLLHRCAKHYLNALLSDGLRGEAIKFVQTCDSELKVATL